MMGGDVLPQNAFAPKGLLAPPKHEYVTAEASLLVAVLVVFYMAVILILFGVNVPCIRMWKGKLPISSYNDYRKPDVQSEDDSHYDDLRDIDANDDDQLLNSSKELQVVVVNGAKNKVLTLVTPTLEVHEEKCLEGVSIL